MGVQLTIPAERGIREREAGTWLDRFIDGYVAEAARLTPEKPVVIDSSSTLTYAEANRAIDAIARSLHGLGVRRGDVVSWQLPNWHEAFLLHHAILRAAAVSNPIVPIYRRHEVEYMLREAGSRVLVIPQTFRAFDYVAMADGLRPALPELAHVVVVRPQQPTESDFAVLTRADGPPLDLERSPDDPMLLMFTSGTTARPKGVLHTHNTLDYENRSIIEIFELGRDDTIFMPSPLSHITGLLYGIQLPAMLQTAVVLQDIWEPRGALALLAEHHCTITVAATPFLHGLTHHPELARFDLSALRLFACGGADVPPGLVRDARALLGCYVTRIYGSTEVPTLSTTGAHDPPVKGSQTDGRVIGNASYRIVDAGGYPVAPGVIGDLEAKGPETFVGYLHPQDESDAGDAFTPDGWFRTGDLASADPDGFLSIRGRSKDIVLRGGENISVTEIEELLFEHPDVVEVAIVAMPDPVMVERACAFVVPRNGSRPTLGDLVEFLATRNVAKQKYPERLELVPELPKTQSGKIQKFLLRQEIRSLTERTPVKPTELLDPDIAKAVSALPFESLNDEQVAMIRSVELPSVVSDDVERTDHVLARGACGIGSGAPPQRRPRAVALRLLHSRRRIRHRQQRHGRRAVRPAVSCAGARGRLGRVPPRARDPLSRSAGRLLPRAGVDARACGRARHRPQPHRRSRDQRGRWSCRGTGPAGPRSRGGVTRVPTPRLPDARRSAGHVLEPAGGATGVEPRVEHLRLAVLSRRPLRRRRRSLHGGSGPGEGPVEPATGLRIGRHGGWLPR